jgi:large subunit ribosomal protein L21
MEQFCAMKYIVARIGNRQFKLNEGSQVTVDHFDGKINEILLLVDGDDVKIGRPLVDGVRVKTKVVADGFEKTEIRRFKAKSRYRKKKGHKQPVTKLVIEKIEVR